jgi:hypothetical protein
MSDNKQEQTTLTDVLGALVTSVGHARVQADLSAIDIARMYHEHELLRGMSIPRLRLNKVEISIPLVLTNIKPDEIFELETPEDASAKLIKDLQHKLAEIEMLNAEVENDLSDDDIFEQGSALHKQIQGLNENLKDIRKAFINSINDDTPSKFKFGDRFTNAIKRALAPFDQKHPSVDAALDIEEAVSKAIENVLLFKLAIRQKWVRQHKPAGLSSTLLLVLYGKKDAETLIVPVDDDDNSNIEGLYSQLLEAIPSLLKEMKALARSQVFFKPAQGPKIEVAALSSDVQNQGTPGTITRLNIAMTEEGLEWAAESNDRGGQDWKLMQE